MRNLTLSTGCCYHVYNRGVEKRKIFSDKFDYRRFLETVDFYRKAPTPMKLSDFRRGKKQLFKKEVPQRDLVRVYCYCLMPNHFHFLIQQIEDDGVSRFMHKLADSFTRYFNTKHERVGSLFQGPFKAKLVETDEHLLHLSKYIHKNPSKLDFPHSVWEAREYPYSSYRHYLSGEIHPFCETDLILSYFSKANPGLDYQSFVEDKLVDDPSIFSSLIDSED